MEDFNYIGHYINTGIIGSGTIINGTVASSAESYSCDDIQIALQDLQAPAAYPVDCDFITLNGTGIILFMDPGNEQLTGGVEVNNININNGNGFIADDIIFIYSIETAFFIILILMWTIIRQFKKISSNLF